jgi:ABC-type dipeptide/oligopeptide/nickel transport system permease subunit
MKNEQSYLRQVWQKLSKNVMAVISLCIIMLCLLLSIFAYVIAPDNTPNANLQIVEIQAKKPGFSQQFLVIKNSPPNDQSTLKSLMFGKPSDKRFIPITSYTISGNEIMVQRYVDEDTSVLERYNINSVTGNHPADIDKHIIVRKYWLGTDAFGRDILSRLIIGTRISLAVGMIAVIISLLLGIILGSFAAYYRGRVDAIIMWLINVSWSIPTLLLVFAITIAMGKGFWQIFIAIGLTMWINVARLVRGQVLAVKELEFIQAARALGYNSGRIIFRHMLPNITGPILVIAAGNFATAIILEAGLSFLGIGLQPPNPSWGLMIKENYNFIITHNPMLALIPGFAIMLLVFAFNILGNGLRDATDVKN